MYSYDTECLDSKNDLKRLQNSCGKYKLVHEFTHEDLQHRNDGGSSSVCSHNVTAMANVNSIASPLIISATSDKY